MQEELSGELGAGQTKRSEVTFEINKNEKKWELVIDPYPSDPGQAVFKITEEDLKLGAPTKEKATN